MRKELSFFALPVCSILWAAGGTWDTDIRRIGVPLLLLAVILAFKGFKWRYLGYALTMALVLRLPFTLFGDGVQGNILNWIWLWALGYLLGIPSVFLLGTFAFWISLAPMSAQGLFGTLSNIPLFQHAIVHKLVECITGFWAGFPMVYYINASED